MKQTRTAIQRPTPLRAVLLLCTNLLSLAVFAADYPPTGDFSRGAKSWANNCTRCHNMRDPKELRDDQWITTVFHMRIRAGLTGQEARDILTFLQQSNQAAPKQPAAATAAATPEQAKAGATGPAQNNSLSGEAIYAQTCIACHGPDGTGLIPGTPNFTAKNGPLTQQDAVLIEHITLGYQSPGSPMAMPPKGGNSALTQADIKQVLAYIRKTFAR